MNSFQYQHKFVLISFFYIKIKYELKLVKTKFYFFIFFNKKYKNYLVTLNTILRFLNNKDL